MKLLAVIFLASFALASALPVVHDHGVQEAAKEFDFFLNSILADDDSSNDVAEKLRESFNQVLEKIREAIEKGKGLREDLLTKLKDVREKMKERGVNLGERAKEILERIREKGREFFQKIMERLNLKSAPRGEHDVVQTYIKDAFEKVLDEIKEAVHKGKNVEEELHQRLRQAFESLRAAKVSMTEKAVETLEHIKEKAKHVFDRIVEDLGFTRQPAQRREHDVVQTYIKEAFEKVLDEIKEAVQKGKGVEEELHQRLRQAYESLRAAKVALTDKAVETLEHIKEEAKHVFDRIVEDLGFDRRAADSDDSSDEVSQKLRDSFEKVLEKIREAIEKGKGLREDLLTKLKDVREKMKERGVTLGERAKEILERIREKGKEFFQRIMDRLNPQSAPNHDAVQTYVKESFEKILEEIKEAVHKGQDIEEEVHERLRQAFDSLRAVKVSLSEKAMLTLEHIREKARHVFDRIAETLGFPQHASAETEIGQKLQETFEEILEKIKEAIDHGKELKLEYIEKLKEVREKMREMRVELSNRAKELIEKVKDRVREFWNNIFDKLKPEQHSITDVYHKIREFFKDLHIELKEKFVKFGEWAKDKFDQGLEKGQDRVENIRNLAKQFIEDAKHISKDVAEDAKEFFREYKEDLGHIYDDLRLKIKDILKNN